MGEIVEFNGITLLDLPVQRILDRASEAKLTTVVVLGYDEDGDEYFASSISDGADVIWIMERAKLKLLRVVDRDDD